MGMSWWSRFALLFPVTSLGCAADYHIVPRPVIQLWQQGSSPDGRQISGGTAAELGVGDLQATALQCAQLIWHTGQNFYASHYCLHLANPSIAKYLHLQIIPWESLAAGTAWSSAASLLVH